MTIVKRLTLKRIAIAAVSIVVVASATIWAAHGERMRDKHDPFSLGGKVKRLAGDHLKLTDRRSVEFAALRLPYDSEPYAAEARRTLTKWVADEGVRLQYDELREFKNQRILAYVYANDTFINVRLVRDGLAFVKLREGNRRHAEALLTAQKAARDEAKGMWGFINDSDSGNYLGDVRSATFHRPSCPDAAQSQAFLRISGRSAAFDQGLAPCGRCKPLDAEDP